MTAGSANGAAPLDARVRKWLESVPDFRFEDPMIAAVSGGVDSIVLLDVLVAAGCEVTVAHVHHRLRGEAADLDEAFVAGAAAALGRPYVRLDLDEGWALARRGRSLQEEARRLRYDRLEALARRLGAPTVATGHTRDDQAETVLLNLGRGSGPAGLAGMAPVRNLATSVRLIRPLLNVSRLEIEVWAGLRGLSWREDASNAGLGYRRNAIRHDLIPAYARLVGGDVAERIAHTADLVRTLIETELRPMTDVLMSLLVRREAGSALALPLGPLNGLPPIWRTRLALEALSMAFPDASKERAIATRIVALAGAQVGRRIPVPGGAVWRERDSLVFAPEIPRPLPADATPPDAGGAVPPRSIPWAGDRIVLLEAEPTTGRRQAERPDRPGDLDGNWTGYRPLLVDRDRAAGEWILRPWEPGDRVTLPGSRSRARVKTLLTDAKVPSYRRAHEAVLTAGGQVVCLVGHRVDAAFEPTTGSRNLVEIVRTSAPDAAGQYL